MLLGLCICSLSKHVHAIQDLVVVVVTLLVQLVVIVLQLLVVVIPLRAYAPFLYRRFLVGSQTGSVW